MRAVPYLVLDWTDEATGARGWLVLNSLRGGAAGGGTRMRAGLGLDEVTWLAKGMELKFAFSGPPIGGGKSGIDFDPSDPRRREVLTRWFRAIRPMLLEVYGTGGDVNVDEQRDVSPLCREMGLVHPQQGIVNGHFRAAAAGGTPRSVEEANRSLGKGLGLRVSDPALDVSGANLSVSDLITGYGVARAAARGLAGTRAGEAGCLDGVRVIVEGFGNVGGPAALYLARMGARIVAITDARAGIAPPGGLDAAELEDLLRARDRRDIPPHPHRVEGPAREDCYSVAADLFVPAAVSASVDANRLTQLEAAGVRTIVCGANHPLREAALGDTTNQQDADTRFAILADVVGSMGMARAFHHLMVGGPTPRAEEVFEAVRDTMDETIDQLLVRHAGLGPGLLAQTLAVGLDRIDFD
ncbi:MAG TPA: Glu/Leu/Phe/Val dehydrogenase dimerization domain-containing protein [Longimicrobiales bacterium]|nr:Glu/Leu/Phe/Val dehydrogenase dimerization domain-containing protein [Longimicrobiales bacterium]